MSDDNSTFIRLEREGPIAIVTFDNPPVNVLTDKVLNELDSAIDAVLLDRNLRVIILRSMGEKAFMAGADIQQFPSLTSESGRVLVEKGKKIFDKVAGARVPVICAIQGLALGAGLELALACDIRIAEVDAKLGFPETGLGILPGYAGTQRISRLVGLGKAKELVLTGELLTAKEANEMGLVERVVPKGESFDKAKMMAEKIASKAPIAIAKAKIAVDKGFEMPLHEGQKLETYLFAELCDTDDMQEGVLAFMEKRKAVFLNK